MKPLVQVLAVIVVILAAYHGYTVAGIPRAIIQALGAVAVIIVVLLLLNALGVSILAVQLSILTLAVLSLARL